MDTPAQFRTTQWSVVLSAQQSDSTQARAAMEKLGALTAMFALWRKATGGFDREFMGQDFVAARF